MYKNSHFFQGKNYYKNKSHSELVSKSYILKRKDFTLSTKQLIFFMIFLQIFQDIPQKFRREFLPFFRTFFRQK